VGASSCFPPRWSPWVTLKGKREYGHCFIRVGSGCTQVKSKQPHTVSFLPVFHDTGPLRLYTIEGCLSVGWIPVSEGGLACDIRFDRSESGTRLTVTSMGGEGERKKRPGSHPGKG